MKLQKNKFMQNKHETIGRLSPPKVHLHPHIFPHPHNSNTQQSWRYTNKVKT